MSPKHTTRPHAASPVPGLGKCPLPEPGSGPLSTVLPQPSSTRTSAAPGSSLPAPLSLPERAHVLDPSD